MKTKILLASLILTLAFSACGPEHKSVLEPLTPEEADNLVGKYDHFLDIYEHIIFPKVNQLSSQSLLKQRLKDLSYGDFMEFYNRLLDNDYKERASEEWDKKYDLVELTRQVDSMADSIEAYWENYKENESPRSYISVELLDIEKKSWVDDSWGYSRNKLDVSLKLKVIPMKGKIDKLSVGYVLYKGNTENIGAYAGNGKIEIDAPFDTPVTVTSKLEVADYKPWMSSTDYKEYIRNNSVETIMKQCHISVNSPELTIDGMVYNLKVFSDKIPYYATHYKELRQDTASADYKDCRDSFIREEIDKTYYEKETWVLLRVFQMEYDFNPLAFTLYYGEDMIKQMNIYQDENL